MYALKDNKSDLDVVSNQQLELIEASYWMKYYRGDTMLPTYSSIIRGAIACALPSLDILAMNRVIGLGLGSVIDETSIRQIIHFYEQAGSRRFFIQLPPAILTEDTVDLLSKRGFVHHNNWMKLCRRVEPLSFETNPELSIRTIDQSEADNYGQLIFMSFDWEDSRLASWLASTVGQVGYSHYIVSWKGKDIAAGALYVEGKMASMAFAGTLEPFRGKGAQLLLLKTRMQHAWESGACWITSETAEHTEDRPVKSYVNMRKCGFEVAYPRSNWIFSFFTCQGMKAVNMLWEGVF